MGTKIREVGGLPIFFCQTGTSAGTPADIVCSCGFVPDYVKFCDDVAATNPNWIEWFKGMTSGKGILTTGSTGVTTQDAADAIEMGTDAFTICSEIQTASKVYSVIAFRYSG